MSNDSRFKRRLEIAKSLAKFYPPKHFDPILNPPVVEEETVEDLVISVDYSSMTVSELKVIAKENSIPAYYKLKKSDLIEALNALE